jgi:hypothetical protein
VDQLVVVAGFWGDGFSGDNWGSGWEECCLCLGLGLYGGYEIRYMRRTYAVCIICTVRLEGCVELPSLPLPPYDHEGIYVQHSLTPCLVCRPVHDCRIVLSLPFCQIILPENVCTRHCIFYYGLLETKRIFYGKGPVTCIYNIYT